MRMDSERKVTAAGEPLIEFRGVDKFFDKPEEGRYQVVGDLNIKVRENEFLVLFGPGQCGKSTILNLIAGFEMPSSGHVLCMGKDITGPGPDRGMVFQNTALFPWLTVMGNVEYGPKVRGIKKEERRQRAQHYIDLVGLQGFENSFPVKLSGGMQQRVGIARAYCNANVEEMLDIVGLTKFRNYYPSQLSISMLQRVAIARAFATKPELLLMDEPYGQLDIDLRFKLEDELIKLWKKTGTTVLFITHNIEEAVYLSQKIMVLTNKPTSVKTVLDNPLPLPRDVVSPEFVELRNKVTDLIKWW